MSKYRFSHLNIVGAVALLLGLSTQAKAKDWNDPIQLTLYSGSPYKRSSNSSYLDRIPIADVSQHEVADDLGDESIDQGKDPGYLVGTSGVVLREFSFTIGATVNYFRVFKRGKEFNASSIGYYLYAEGQLHVGTWNYLRFEAGLKAFFETGWFKLSHRTARYDSDRRLAGLQAYGILRDVFESRGRPALYALKFGGSLAYTWDKGGSGGTGTYRQRYEALQLGLQAEGFIYFPFRFLTTPESHKVIVRKGWAQNVFDGWFPELRVSYDYVRDISIHARTSFVQQGNRIGSEGRNRNERHTVIVDLVPYRFTNDTKDVREENLRTWDPFLRFAWGAATGFGYNSVRDGSFVNSIGGGLGLRFRLTDDVFQLGIEAAGTVSYEDRGFDARGPDRVQGLGTFGFYLNFG